MGAAHGRALLSLSLVLTLVLAGAPGASAAEGGLDATFDGDGIKTNPVLSSYDGSRAVAVQPDGKIVAAGYASNGSSGPDFAVARYNANGTLDTSFAGDGLKTTDFFGDEDYANAVAVQRDGKIVVAGDAEGAPSAIALARYNTNGTLDTSFDGDGRKTTFPSSSSQAHAMTLQSDGKIVVAGQAFNGSNNEFMLIRYNPNGTMDTSFSGDGIRTNPVLGAGDLATAVVVQPDGKIVAAGFAHNGSNHDFALARYNANGALDTSFDGDGVATNTILPSNNDEAWAVALQRDGKIVVAGWALVGNYDFALARFNANGTMDTSFDGDGLKMNSVLSGEDRANAVAVQPDGKIVVAGYAYNGSNKDFALARYDVDGSLDTTLDGDGLKTNAILGGNDQAEGAALQPDGKIVAAGSVETADSDFALARYRLDATPPWGARLLGVPWYSTALTRTLAWTASDNWAVKTFDVRSRSASATSPTYGSYSTLKSQASLPYGTFAGSAGRTYCFSARARDTAGNLSGYGTPSCMATPVDDRSLSRSGPWTSGTSSSYYKGTYRSSTTPGAKLTLASADFHRLAVVVTRCSSCGKLRVYLGSTLLKEINTYSSSTHYKQVLSVGSWAALRSGTVTIKQYQSGRRVIVDGLVASLA